MDATFPLVSVIIPVYNTEEYIGACLDSVLNQTYKNLEIVVVDDGSTDSSSSIIEKYRQIDSRISCIHKQNAGLPLARKTGVERATGKYIQHLDSDDTLIDDAIERLVCRAEKTDADIVVAPFFFCYQGEAPQLSVNLRFEELSGEDYYREILTQHAYWSVWSNFQKRSLFQDHPIQFLPEISFGEDAVLMTQLVLYASKVAAIHEPILNYNRYITSMSFQVDDSKYRQYRFYRHWIEEYLDSRKMGGKFGKELARMHIQTTFDCIRWGRYEYMKSDMKRLIGDLNKYPDLQPLLSRKEKQLVSYFRISFLLGCYKAKSYVRKHKL